MRYVAPTVCFAPRKVLWRRKLRCITVLACTLASQNVFVGAFGTTLAPNALQNSVGATCNVSSFCSFNPFTRERPRTGPFVKKRVFSLTDARKKRGFLDCVEFRKIKSCFKIENFLIALRKYTDAPTLKVSHPVRFSSARYRATKLRNWGVWGEYRTDPACVSYTKAMRYKAWLIVLTSRRLD